MARRVVAICVVALVAACSVALYVDWLPARKYLALLALPNSTWSQRTWWKRPPTAAKTATAATTAVTAAVTATVTTTTTRALRKVRKKKHVPVVRGTPSDGAMLNRLSQADAWRQASKLCNGSDGGPMLVFVHIFKAAGSTTRKTLKVWSESRGNCSFSQAGGCGGRRRRLTFSSFARSLAGGLAGLFSPGDSRRRLARGTMCTRNGHPAHVEHSKVDVLAGHVWFGTFRTAKPAIYVTCLRDPLTLKLSAIVYLNRKQLAKQSLDDAAVTVAAKLGGKASGGTIYDNFLKRLGSAPGTPSEAAFKKGSHENVTADIAHASADRAVEALEHSFAVVGLTEKYTLFYAQLAKLLPAAGSPDFWRREVQRHENPAPHSTSAIRDKVPAAVLASVNRTLQWEYRIYAAAVDIHDRRCKEHLPADVCEGRRAPDLD